MYRSVSGSIQKENSVEQDVDVSYWTDTTEGSTFESDKIKWWTETLLSDSTSVLNPCAGKVELDTPGETLRVDLKEENNADLHIDFRDLLDHVEEESFDAIVYDPPYSWYQAKHKYNIPLEEGEFYYYDEAIKRLFDKLLKPGGIFIQFGYTTEAMPIEFGYKYTALGIFNKLGGQNDYFGVAARKPYQHSGKTDPVHTCNQILQNDNAELINGGNISTGGNGGSPINVVYRQEHDKDYTETLTNEVGRWITNGDRVLHIYDTERRIKETTSKWTTCKYDLGEKTENGSTEADFCLKPWNIGAKFATGIFDVVILDLPYSAWQEKIKTPYEQATSGSDKTHVNTAIKRSITDLVSSNNGEVIQVSRTATTMSGNDYNYIREGVTVLQHHEKDTDRFIAVDRKDHDNLELAGLGEGDLDSEKQRKYGIPDTTDRKSRTDFKPYHHSETCIHCGNSTHHHMATYVWCPDCGAAAGEMCRREDGTLRHPTGPDHSITTDDICDERIENCNRIHDGSCNGKQKTHLKEPSDEDRKKKNKTDQATFTGF